ncbi:hypothetical protein CVT25_003722 [Psilocybe cyanescens]|uniref:Uncharacterized protein n=1 Tax=Psilocybe cyanescens TaxID=93625 RepID=A0A409XKN9_PSICY|nr:hypothetical protein CVT25_003722 [Psilocybe cyanescens]
MIFQNTAAAATLSSITPTAVCMLMLLLPSWSFPCDHDESLPLSACTSQSQIADDDIDKSTWPRTDETNVVGNEEPHDEEIEETHEGSTTVQENTNPAQTHTQKETKTQNAISNASFTNVE